MYFRFNLCTCDLKNAGLQLEKVKQVIVNKANIFRTLLNIEN